jgi:hypothetical protein
MAWYLVKHKNFISLLFCYVQASSSPLYADIDCYLLYHDRFKFKINIFQIGGNLITNFLHLTYFSINGVPMTVHISVKL